MCDHRVSELCALDTFYRLMCDANLFYFYGSLVLSDPFPRDQLSGIFTAFPAAFRGWIANRYTVFRLHFQKDFHTDHDALANS